MAIPKYHEFMKSILQLLDDAMPQKRLDLYEKLALQFCLTEEEMEEWLPSGKHKVYKNRIGWALTYLKKAGLIESPIRGTFAITDLGKTVLNENPEVVDQEYLMKFDSFKGFKENSVNSDGNYQQIMTPSSGESPQEILDRAYKDITSTLTDDILSEVINQTPRLL